MIKLFLTDVDGTLTDGGYYVLPTGERVKKFNTKDFHGMHLLLESGVKIGVVSRADCKITRLQFEGVFKDRVDVHLHVQNKANLVRAAYLNKYSMDEIAFIGDDEPDAELLSLVGWPACPSNAEFDAHVSVMSNLDGKILSRRGGDGCVREFIDYILMYNKSRRER